MSQRSKGPGVVRPVVNLNRCEAKGPCVDACPYNVFEIRPIEQSDYDALSLIGKLRSKVHGGKVAYTPRADLCEACGLCVPSCPEKAIKLVPTENNGASGRT